MKVVANDDDQEDYHVDYKKVTYDELSVEMKQVVDGKSMDDTWESELELEQEPI